MRRLGSRLERLALKHLKRSGLRLLAQNFNCRGGEVDLIMRDDDQLVFVEVRGRSSQRFGGAAASVTPRKQRRVAVAAGTWLAQNPGHANRPCRFDVVALDGVDGDLSAPKVEWIRGAFQAGA